jgi:hypothetical protein
VFPQDTFHVFWPNDRVDVLPGPLQLSDIGDLTRVDLELDKPRDPAQLAGGAPDPIGVDLKLAAAMGPPRRVVATLIQPEHAQRLKRILFALPPVSLKGHKIAVTDRGILVVGSENLDGIPLGQLLSMSFRSASCSTIWAARAASSRAASTCRSAWTSCRAYRPT